MLKFFHRVLDGRPTLLILEDAHSWRRHDRYSPVEADMLYNYLKLLHGTKLPIFLLGATSALDYLPRRIRQLFTHQMFLDLPDVTTRVEAICAEIRTPDGQGGGVSISEDEIQDLARDRTEGYQVDDLHKVFDDFRDSLRQRVWIANRWGRVSSVGRTILTILLISHHSYWTLLPTPFLAPLPTTGNKRKPSGLSSLLHVIEMVGV